MNIVLNREQGAPLVEQLAAQLRAQIQTGALAAGTRLPTVKALAAELGLNHNTVASAYRLLAAEGRLVQRTRAGTQVAARPELGPKEALALHLSTDLAARLRPFAASLSPAELREVLGLAEAQLGAAAPTPPLRVAVLASTPLQADTLARRYETLLSVGGGSVGGAGAAVRPVQCVPQTLEGYRSSDFHFTLVDPELLLELRDGAAQLPLSTLATWTPMWAHDHDVPAGAD